MRKCQDLSEIKRWTLSFGSTTSGGMVCAFLQLLNFPEQALALSSKVDRSQRNKHVIDGLFVSVKVV